jgi:S-layer homology domain.
MTRAMFAQVLYALEGAPSVRGLSCPFTDAGGSWYTDAVIWAYNAGVVAGVSPTRFAPNEALTREQMRPCSTATPAASRLYTAATASA